MNDKISQLPWGVDLTLPNEGPADQAAKIITAVTTPEV